MKVQARGAEEKKDLQVVFIWASAQWSNVELRLRLSYTRLKKNPKVYIFFSSSV